MIYQMAYLAKDIIKERIENLAKKKINRKKQLKKTVGRLETCRACGGCYSA